jgi:hypothetical protein
MYFVGGRGGRNYVNPDVLELCIVVFEGVGKKRCRAVNVFTEKVDDVCVCEGSKQVPGNSEQDDEAEDAA